MDSIVYRKDDISKLLIDLDILLANTDLPVVIILGVIEMVKAKQVTKIMLEAHEAGKL